MIMNIEIHQIAYSPETLAGVDPGFRALDNLANSRPDWWEYWPVRRFLRETPLRDEAFYGFLSPRFRDKTGLSAVQVHEFVAAAASDADVITFSPQVDMGAFFLNLFEQNEMFDPGFTEASQAFFDAIGYPVELGNLMMDSRQVVISNYFVARRGFWSAWLAINERLFEICEGPDSALKGMLIAPTTYRNGTQRKVFLSERIASLLLATQPQWRVRAFNPYGLAWSASRLSQFPRVSGGSV